MTENTTGQPARFDELLAACLPTVRKRIDRWVRRADGVDADDVLHDTIVRALIHRDDFATATDLLRWCSTTAKRRVCEVLRSPEEIHHVATADITGAVDASGATTPDPAEIIGRAETIAAVRAALATLSPRDRALLETSAYREMPQRDIAAAMDMTVPQVNMLLHRARIKLRAALRPMHHLAVVPVLSWRTRRAVRRGLWPTQLPGPVLATGAMVVGITAVLQYAVPARLPANAQEPPSIATAAAPQADTDTRPGLAAALPSSTAATPPGGSRQHRAHVIGSVVERPEECQITCLPVPPPSAPSTTVESGDTITLVLPDQVQAQTGEVYVRENYTPICEHWMPNSAARCERTGDPNWTVHPSDPHRPGHGHQKETPR